jgi:N-acetyl sugar amidotransferase
MSKDKAYQQCSISVMDTIADPDINFDENGISNYYHEFKKGEIEYTLQGIEGEKRVDEIIQKIKAAGKDKPYDCIVGLSGGVDSSYIVYLAKQYGLRPLVVHFDNGWNSELAVKNIESMVSKLGFDLYTLVVNWDEFKDIQLAYLKASVIDIEVVTDHAITGTIARLCKKHGIKYSLSGSNVVTEFIMPKSWIFNKSDHVNLKAIHKAFGLLPLKTYPIFNTYLKKYLSKYLTLESISLLNYLPYNKDAVKNLITKELGWRDYGGKHYESIFTKFYQAYILPTKFGVDKRKAHLSNLILSGQITKQEALEELAKPLYEPADFKKDYEFVLKKFGLTDVEFQNLMKLPVKKHTDFEIETSIFKRYPILRIVKPFARLINKQQ